MSTIALGGESINLTPAEYCIFLDRSWSPAQNLQAVGRVYRPGQTKVVEVIHIDAVETVDARVLHNVSTKTGWFHLLFDD
jgi:SNF2 family DNA or RNA helicase